MKLAAEKHLDEAAAFIAVAESGDAKQAAYRRAAEEIAAAKVADPELSNREAARRIGKSDKYVAALLDALRSALRTGEFHLEWQRGDRDRVGAEKIAREQPEAFAAAYQQAPPKVQRQIAKQIAADPFVQQEVSRRNAQERKRQIEEANARRDATAVPLPAYMARMVVKINEWAAGLASLVDELDQLPPGHGRELVLESVSELERQAHRWVERLDERPELTVIEGRKAG